MAKATFVVVRYGGAFFGYGKWVTEYPDAQEFDSLSKARNVANKTGGHVVKDYGLDTEEKC